MTTRETAQAKLEQILSAIKIPSGFSRLNPRQKKFLFGVVLSSVVPSDHIVKPCEKETLERQLRVFLQLHGQEESDAMAMADMPPLSVQQLDLIAMAIAELLNINDRALFVRHLWELALCDRELHSAEEKLIFRISDAAGVTRKQVAEQLAWVSAQT
jgi:uncharacterized tellurite resistance protein B-like protein